MPSDHPTYFSEADAQDDLVERLSTHFHIEKDVEIQPLAFPDRILRPDLVALPRDPEFSDFLISFEVKIGRPKKTGEYARHLKQASDYVLGKIIDPRFPNNDGMDLKDRRIQAAFLYPGYSDSYFDGQVEKIRRLYGMHQLAALFKVGKVVFQKDLLTLVMGAGANEVWKEGKGWLPHAEGRIKGKRQIGSQKIKLGNF